MFRGTRKAFLLIALLALALIGLTCMASCAGVTLHEDHDHGAEGLISTPDEAVDYILTFEGKTCLASRGGAVAKDGDDVVIIKSGVYRLTGHFDGQLRVSVADTEHVTLIMDDFSITSPDSAALHVVNAGCVYVEVPEGKTATLTDATTYVYDVPGETKPNACIYAADDITFRGLGKLIVNANYNNGIGSKNDLKIKGGSYEINAVKNALKGNDSVTIESGTILITRCNDGIKTDATETGRGILTISGGTIEIHAEDDGLQASQKIDVTGGLITVEALGKVTNCDGETNIATGCLVEK